MLYICFVSKMITAVVPYHRCYYKVKFLFIAIAGICLEIFEGSHGSHGAAWIYVSAYYDTGGTQTRDPGSRWRATHCTTEVYLWGV